MVKTQVIFMMYHQCKPMGVLFVEESEWTKKKEKSEQYRDPNKDLGVESFDLNQ